MPVTKQQTVFISAEVTRGMVAVLKAAAENRSLKHRERRLAEAYAAVLEKTIAAKESQSKVKLSVNVIANTLRVILMVIKPDPLVKALVEFIGHTL